MVERTIIALLGVVFVFLNVWAFAETPLAGPSDFFNIPIVALGEVIPAHRWATVVAADLVLGWVLMAFFIAYFEQNWKSAVIWIVLLFGVGNLVAVIYLASKLPEIRSRMRSG